MSRHATAKSATMPTSSIAASVLSAQNMKDIHISASNTVRKK